jgi:serine/threonine protein kinase
MIKNNLLGQHNWEEEINRIENQIELYCSKKKGIDETYSQAHSEDCSEWSFDAESSHFQENNEEDLFFENKSVPYQYHVCLYIQMQLCHPSTVADWILHRNNMQNEYPQSNFSSELHIFIQIVSGVNHFHSKGIVHRDLKPANIFLAEDGVVKIGDFGLSKIIDQNLKNPSTSLLLEASIQSSQETDSSHHTRGIGTASYAAPEQLDSHAYGPKADIFSLGLILLELLCRFQTAHERAMAFRDCRHQRVVLPINLPKETVSDFLTIIIDCTSIDPDQRPSANSLLEKLKSFTTSNFTFLDCKTSSIIAFNEVHSLKQQLENSNSELRRQKQKLIEKDYIISDLQKQINDLYAQNDSSSSLSSNTNVSM